MRRILRKLDRIEVAKELKARNKQEREKILAAIKRADAMVAAAIRMELVNVLEASGDHPRSRIEISQEGKPEIVAKEFEPDEAVRDVLAAEEADADAEAAALAEALAEQEVAETENREKENARRS